MYFTKKSCNSIKFTLKIKLQENIMINSSETIAIWKNVSPFPSIFFVWISFSNPLNYEVPYPVWVWFKSLLTHSTSIIEDSDSRTDRQPWPDCNRTATLLDEALSLRRRAPLAVTWSRCPYLPCTTPWKAPLRRPSPLHSGHFNFQAGPKILRSPDRLDHGATCRRRRGSDRPCGGHARIWCRRLTYTHTALG